MAIFLKLTGRTQNLPLYFLIFSWGGFCVGYARRLDGKHTKYNSLNLPLYDGFKVLKYCIKRYSELCIFFLLNKSNENWILTEMHWIQESRDISLEEYFISPPNFKNTNLIFIKIFVWKFNERIKNLKVTTYPFIPDEIKGTAYRFSGSY